MCMRIFRLKSYVLISNTSSTATKFVQKWYGLMGKGLEGWLVFFQVSECLRSENIISRYCKVIDLKFQVFIQLCWESLTIHLFFI